MDPIVSMTGISKSFSGNQVLDDVSFELFPGEVHALMGENGAGKSTLMKILTGIYTKDSGTIMVEGKERSFKNTNESEAAGISVIHQELNLIPHLTVVENLFLGKELKYGVLGILKNKQMQLEAERLLRGLGLDISLNERVANLSVGHQQMIEIAKAISTNAKVIIMDEPTAALTDKEINKLFEVIDQLKQKGVGIVYISHRMEEIFKICDRISVLRDGKYIGTKATSETSIEELVKWMVGRELGERFPKRKKFMNGKEKLRIENLSLPGIFENVSFSVKEGEVLGIAGLMGAGRSEIVETIFGARKKSSGTIFIDGKPVNIKNPIDAIRAGIGFVTEDRKAEGLVLSLTVRENVTLTNLKSVSRAGVISHSKEKHKVNDLINRLKVKTHTSELEVKSLSGGNQQKVVIGKWLGINPKILILDEPTRGVDIGAKKEIYTIINELTEKGVAVIMVSSEMPEILGMSDRILVIHEGKVTADICRAEADQEIIMTAATGGGNH